MAKKGHRPGRKVRISTATEKFIIAGLVLCCVGALAFSTYMVVKSFGKDSLREHGARVFNKELAARLNDIPLEEGAGEAGLKEGQILVEGEVYGYNEDLLTFLCMGVDTRSGIQEEKEPGKAGQADAILLVVADPHKEKIRAIALNRDTMTDIRVYDVRGVYLGEEEGQLALQYAYGDGQEGSCELMEQAVSDLLYGIPIHGYGALDMRAIGDLNDALGGVTVTIPEDMTEYHPKWSEGSEVLLEGEEALLYIRARETGSEELGTNIRRMERQGQYLSRYAQGLKEKLKEDLTFLAELYGKVEGHLVTSLKAEEITYLADTLAGYGFSMEDIIRLEGEARMGEEHEEFYLDEQALREAVIEVFYEKVEE